MKKIKVDKKFYNKYQQMADIMHSCFIFNTKECKNMRNYIIKEMIKYFKNDNISQFIRPFNEKEFLKECGIKSTI